MSRRNPQRKAKFAHIGDEQLSSAIKQAQKDVNDWFHAKATFSAMGERKLFDEAFRKHKTALKSLNELSEERSARWKERRRENVQQ